MKIWQLINFDYIYCQNFSMKTKFILGFLFIMITLVGLHNIHVLNYTRNIFKKLHTKHQKIFSRSFSKSLPNTGKWDSFLENALWKMNLFPENINAETNRASIWTMINISILQFGPSSKIFWLRPWFYSYHYGSVCFIVKYI